MEFWLITNNIKLAEFATKNYVKRIFIDLEKLGKFERQGHLNSWKSHHMPEDIKIMKNIIKKNILIVRLNPFNQNTEDEINYSIKNGADYLMLPMIKKLDDVKIFCQLVAKRVEIIPLIETKESIDLLPKIIEIDGINEIYIGLNDLSLSLGLKFMFEPLINGILEDTSKLLNLNGIKWGFGGIARIGEGLLPAEYIIGEHIRLKSNKVILSRTFFKDDKNNFDFNNKLFAREISKLNHSVNFWLRNSEDNLQKNKQKVKNLIEEIILNK